MGFGMSGCGHERWTASLKRRILVGRWVGRWSSPADIAAHRACRVAGFKGEWFRQSTGTDAAAQKAHPLQETPGTPSQALNDALAAVSANKVALEVRTVELGDGDVVEIQLEQACWSALDDIGTEQGLDLRGLCEAARCAYPDETTETALWHYTLDHLRARL